MTYTGTHRCNVCNTFMGQVTNTICNACLVPRPVAERIWRRIKMANSVGSPLSYPKLALEYPYPHHVIRRSVLASMRRDGLKTR